ncbi:MAG TPA: hypothetical protein VL689_12220 [Paraburkholderia sp.]|jgi:hypothetical protein|nr:hypothetical protein [Paraburkholderia sp.]
MGVAVVVHRQRRDTPRDGQCTAEEENRQHGEPAPEKEQNTPTFAFTNLKDRKRLIINLEAPDAAAHQLSQTDAKTSYNVELVDSLMNQMTRVAGNTQDLMSVRQKQTTDGFSLGDAQSALDDIRQGGANDAMVRRVLGHPRTA